MSESQGSGIPINPQDQGLPAEPPRPGIGRRLFSRFMPAQQPGLTPETEIEQVIVRAEDARETALEQMVSGQEPQVPGAIPITISQLVREDSSSDEIPQVRLVGDFGSAVAQSEPDENGLPKPTFVEKKSAMPVEVIEGVENPLGELSVDQQTFAAFEFYFKKVTSGQISPDQLALRLQAVSVDTNRYLKDENGDFVRFPAGTPRANQAVQVLTNEQFAIKDPEQKQVLRDIFSEFTEAVSEKEASFDGLRALDFYTGKIVSGQISPDQLALRLQAVSVDTNRYLKDENGDFVRFPAGTPRANEAVQVLTNEQFAIKDPEQKQVLRDIFSEFTEAVSEKEASFDGLRALDFYTGKIVSGQISPDQLALRLQAVSVDTNRYLKDENGDFVRFPAGTPRANEAVQVLTNEQFAIKDPEQKQIVTEISSILNDNGIPDEIRGLVRNYLQNQNPADLARAKTILSEQDSQSGERIEGVIDSLTTIRKRLELKRDFYDALSVDKPGEGALAVLSRYEGQDTTDVAIRVELANRAAGIRRAQIAREFTSLAVAPTPDVDTAIKALGNLGSSSVPEDVALATVLAKSIYRAELASNRARVTEMITLDADPQQIYAFIDSLPIRPSIEDLDYLGQQVRLKDKVRELYVGIGKIARLKRANEIREEFTRADVDTVIADISALPNETQEEIAVKAQLLTLYKNYAAANQGVLFDERFGQEINAKVEADLKALFERKDLGDNVEAFTYLRDNYKKALEPLVEAFRNDPRTKGEMSKYLDLQRNGKMINPRLKYVIQLSELESQRPLTDLERSYLDSVKLLTLYNPFVIGILSADSGAANEYLRHHFDNLSALTLEDLKDGDYVPLLQVGTGPSGLAALAEVVRNDPELANQMLIVDAGEQPGGPFAIPKGPAWELNSANRRGEGGYTMPDAPNGNELKSVRSYGSPVARWYPGERARGSDVRAGSINTTVDYLPTPDDLSTNRYPTNEELQLTLAAQTALLTRNLALNTCVISQEPNTNPDKKGDKLVKLQVTNNDGSKKDLQIYTDATFDVTGLGEPTYGFALEGSRASDVIAEVKGSDGFPKFSTTLEAFRGLADRTQEKASPGETLIIYGKGNSADTIIENIGNLFQGDNPRVREVTKIYIVADGDLSRRPRYALISDLKPRNGRGNLIEQVNARVADVDFLSRDVPIEDRKLVVYNPDGSLITDSLGKPIQADSVIAATGFRSQLDSIYSAFLDGKSTRDSGVGAPLQPLTLPTNPEVAVAEYFNQDPNILILGTASKPEFTSLEKLGQLPREAREALLRNGAENAVAIGFRAPDTQAAVNIWLNSREVNLSEKPIEPLPKIPIGGNNPESTTFKVENTISSNISGIPNVVDTVDGGELVLSSLLSYNIGNSFELAEDFTGSASLDLKFDEENNQFPLIYNGGVGGVSSEFLSGLTTSLSDEFFQKYTMNVLSKRRRDPTLKLNIAFSRGKVDPKNTFVQAS